MQRREGLQILQYILIINLKMIKLLLHSIVFIVRMPSSSSFGTYATIHEKEVFHICIHANLEASKPEDTETLSTFILGCKNLFSFKLHNRCLLRALPL